jgi:DNA-binding SARP family transcriptional activator/tetratricopeptide (TPR) repeat protein
MVEVAVEFGLLGDVEARIDGRLMDIGHARQRCVLVALLVDADRPVPVDQLLDRVWGRCVPHQTRGTLRSYLSRLRQALAGAAEVDIARQPGGYILAIDPMTVDLHRFRRLTVQARVVDDDQAAAALFDEALGLWRGEAFATLDTPWLTGVRAALDRQRLAAELDRNDLVLERGQHGVLLDGLSAGTTAHPLDERMASQLLLALYRSGRQADALDFYRQLRLRLREELGTDPSPPLRQLHQQILTADPALAVLGRATIIRGSHRRLVPRQLPAPPCSFTGRTSELAALNAAMTAQPDRPATVMICAIGGAGGIGKTWLALRWAHDNLARFPDGQLYVNLRGFDPASDPLPAAVAVRAFLDALGVAQAAIPVDPDSQVGLYRSLVAGKRMLIVVDNARDSAQVAPLLPGTPAASVLVTSRQQLPGLLTMHGARLLSLDVLPTAQARQLLTEHLGPVRVAAEPEPVAVLLDQCAGLPLALGIVAARAAIHPDLPLAGLAQELQESSTRLDALDGSELGANVREVLACSHRALSPEAARVFGLLSLAPGPDLSLPAAVSLIAFPPIRARSLLRELASLHLVQEHVPGRYRMHDLVRLYATEYAHTVHTDIDRSSALHRVLDHYLHTAHAAELMLHPQRDPITLGPPVLGVAPGDFAASDQALAWFTAEHLVLLAAIEHAADAGLDNHTWQLAASLTTFLDRRGHWHDWATTQHAALDAARRLGDQSAQAHAHRGLALAYVHLGRFGEATTQLRHALNLFGALGNRTGQAHTHRSLARVSARQGHFQDALPHAEQALDLYRAAGHRLGQAYALNAIGWFHAHLHNHRQALSYCQQALLLHKEIDDRHGQALAWDSLGYAHHHLGHHHRAIACYLHALPLYREAGDKYRETLALTCLGDTHHTAGHPDPARHAWQHALTILNELDHPDADHVRVKLLPMKRQDHPAATR